jgi:hypothetical protein
VAKGKTKEASSRPSVGKLSLLDVCLFRVDDSVVVRSLVCFFQRAPLFSIEGDLEVGMLAREFVSLSTCDRCRD